MQQADNLSEVAKWRSHSWSTSQKEMYRVLTTKYLHWRYESEMRLFLELNDKDSDNGLYFAEFADRLVLKQVIVGHLSKITRADVQEALGDLANGVEVFKARLAFKTYTVAKQRKEAMWK